MKPISKKNYTFCENGTHRIGVSASANTSKPAVVAGGITYEHKPTDSGIGLTVTNLRTPDYTKNLGTNVNVYGTANVWTSSNGAAKLDAYGSYSRNFGGKMGTGKPNSEIGMHYGLKF